MLKQRDLTFRRLLLLRFFDKPNSIFPNFLMESITIFKFTRENSTLDGNVQNIFIFAFKIKNLKVTNFNMDKVIFRENGILSVRFLEKNNNRHFHLRYYFKTNPNSKYRFTFPLNNKIKIEFKKWSCLSWAEKEIKRQ